MSDRKTQPNDTSVEEVIDRAGDGGGACDGAPTCST